MTRERHYGMDWLRIGAFGLLILYHVGMVFVPWDYHVKTEHPSAWVAIPMLATNAWRLPLLFVVSGFASARMLARPNAGLGRFLWVRTVRLQLPLLFGMAVIVPPQAWVQVTTQHGYAEGFLHFWLHDYFAGQAIGGVMMPSWNHLWFIVYLWLYTLALGALLCLPTAWRARSADLAERALAGPLVIVVPLALLLARFAASWPAPDETHDVVNDLYAHQAYFAAFLFGYFLAGSDATWAAIRRWWKVAAVLAAGSYLAVAGIAAYRILQDIHSPSSLMVLMGLREVQGWCAIVALIGLTDRFCNRDHRWRATLNEGVFPFYVIHQTIIVVVAFWMLGHGVGPAVQALVLVAATTVGCWAFYLAGRAIPPLRPLIGLRWRPSGGKDAAERRVQDLGSPVAVALGAPGHETVWPGE